MECVEVTDPAVSRECFELREPIYVPHGFPKGVCTPAGGAGMTTADGALVGERVGVQSEPGQRPATSVTRGVWSVSNSRSSATSKPMASCLPSKPWNEVAPVQGIATSQPALPPLACGA